MSPHISDILRNLGQFLHYLGRYAEANICFALIVYCHGHKIDTIDELLANLSPQETAEVDNPPPGERNEEGKG